MQVKDLTIPLSGKNISVKLLSSEFVFLIKGFKTVCYGKAY